MISRLFAYLPAFFFLFCSVGPAFAHGEEPRLEISPETLNPGSTLEIRGVGFELEGEVVLVIAGAPTNIPAGRVTADVEGGFLIAINLPSDLAEGTYSIHATSGDHAVASPPFQVWGSAMVEEGADGRREEADGLLAPMPTPAPGFSSTPLPREEAQRGEDSRRDNTILIAGALLTGAALFVMTGLRMRARR